MNQKLEKVYKKYCNGDYGFEHPTSKSGRFQLAMIYLTDKVLNNGVEGDKTGSADTQGTSPKIPAMM